jgi:5,10-methylenetetrahydrofolate reductase
MKTNKTKREKRENIKINYSFNEVKRLMKTHFFLLETLENSDSFKR